MIILDDATLRSYLNDDAPCGDLTTESLGIGDKPARLEFRARQAMVACAGEEAKRMFELAGAHAKLLAATGTHVAKSGLLLEAIGDVSQLHQTAKTAQTLMEWASGLASATASIVAAANGVAVACTRKNVVGTKAISVKAIKAGGGIMHRLGLSETLLVFHEHRQFLDEPRAETIARLRRSQPEKKIVVEVATVDEAISWAEAGADVIQLEKFTPTNVAACRAALNARTDIAHPLLAAAGGIRADNATPYAMAGADLLITSAPYWAPPMDVQVIFRPMH